jgi:hypothetical protein
VAGVGLAVATLALPAESGVWTPPKKLSSFTYLDLPTNTASVAVGPNGDSVAVWTSEANGSVFYATQVLGLWSGARKLYPASAAKGETTSAASVLIEADGSAIALFSSVIPGPIQYCVIGNRVVRCKGPDKSYAKVSTLAPGATAWTPAVNVSELGIAVSNTQIGLDDDGNAVAMWTFVRQKGSMPEIQIAERPSGGSWSAPEALASTSNAWISPTLAVGKRGDRIVAWEEKTWGLVALYAIRARFRASGGGWSAAEDVSARVTGASTLRAGVDDVGSAVLVWDNAYSVKLARRTTSAGWGAPITIASAPGRAYGPTGPFSAYSPDLASNGSGDLLLTWIESDTAAGTWTVEVDWTPSVGAQVHRSFLVDSLYGVPAPHAALSEDRSLAVAAWVDNGAGAAMAATGSPLDGTWSEPTPLGDAVWDTTVAVGSGAGGRASAVWLWGNVTRFSWQFRGSSYR